MNIRGRKRSQLCRLALDSLLVIFCSSWTVRGDETAAPNIGTNTTATFTGTLGWEFIHTGPHYNIYVSQLGVYDAGGDGLANTHRVGLWTSSGSLLVSASVPAGTEARLENGYRYVSVPPVALMPAHYVVAAQYSAGDGDLQRIGIAAFLGPELWFPDYQLTRYAVGADLPFPTNQTGAAQCEGCSPTVAWVVNFQYSFVAPPPRPALRFSFSTNTLTIGWAASATNFALEAASVLSTGVPWQVVTNEVRIVDELCTVAVDRNLHSQFFRLRSISAAASR